MSGSASLSAAADAENLRQEDGDAANHQAADGWPGNEGHRDVPCDPVGGNQYCLEDNRHQGRDDAEEDEGGHLEIGGYVIVRNGEGGDVAEPEARDDRR